MSKNNRYSHCLPINESKISKIDSLINKHKKSYDLFEIWIDEIEDLNNKWLKALTTKFKNRIILKLIRPRSPKDKEIKFLRSLACILDLDYKLHRKLLTSKSKPQIILSLHDYSKTPTITELKKAFDRMRRLPHSIIKIATMCRNQNDAVKLLTLLLLAKSQKTKVIILGMGEEGFPTRILGAMWGNEFSYSAASANKKTAPGQLTKKEFEKAIKIAAA